MHPKQGCTLTTSTYHLLAQVLARSATPQQWPTTDVMVSTCVEARKLAVQCFIEARGDYQVAVRRLKDRWQKKWVEPTRWDKYMRAQVKKWQDRGDMTNAPHSGRSPKLTKDAVDEAAALFSEGFDKVEVVVKREKPIIQHHGFRSITEALVHVPALEQLRRKYQVQPGTLMKRILKSHPQIKRVRRDYKRAFSQEKKRQRREAAGEWLDWHEEEGESFLKRLVSFDEGCIDIKYATDYRRYEYGDATDDRMKTILYAPLCAQAKGGITLWFYIAVNPVVGGVCIYFTTGTTDLIRLETKNWPAPPEGFKVSLCQSRVWVQ